MLIKNQKSENRAPGSKGKKENPIVSRPGFGRKMKKQEEGVLEKDA